MGPLRTGSWKEELLARDGFMLADSKVALRKQVPVLGGCCPSWGI